MPTRRLIQLGICLLTTWLLAACQSTPVSPAPVSDISSTSPYSTSTSATPAPSKATKDDKDWRPDLYIVKKGDTLYSIGLEHGFDYKEIASDNQIEPPYTIKIGQSLKLKNLKNKNQNTIKKTEERKALEKNRSNATDEALQDDSVVTKPLAADNNAPQAKPLNEPISKPLNNKPAAESKAPPPANEANPPAPTSNDINDKLAPQSKTRTLPTPAANSEWSWPTKGKVMNPFNESANAKGIDIEGVLGQEVNAAGNGKVIYNGGDLRGYGNMVIIKHDKDFLSVYAHNNKSLVKEGQLISRGQKIAEMGSSGTDKVKLHFEIRYQGRSVDPLKYLGNLSATTAP